MRNPKPLGASLLFTAIVSVQQGCSMPGPSTNAAALDSMDRIELGVSTSAETKYKLSVLRAGNETMPRVIYVHGTPGNAANWLDYLDQPVAGWEAVAIDRPGFAKSGPGSAVVRLEDQARALEPLLIERDGIKPILVGHSLGGPIVAKAATMYPDRIGAIVIVAGSLDPELEHVLAIQHLGNTVLISWMLPRWAKHSNQELIALEDELIEMDPELAGITIPIVIIHGTADKLVPYENVPFMQERFSGNPAVETITLDKVNHFLIWNQADLVRSAIVRAMEMSGASMAEATDPPATTRSPTGP